MLWSSYTKISLRCSRCFSILPSRLSGILVALSLLTHCFPIVITPPSIFVRCFQFFGKIVVQPCHDLFQKATVSTQIYLYLILPALASLLGLNLSRLWLLPGSTI